MNHFFRPEAASHVREMFNAQTLTQIATGGSPQTSYWNGVETVHGRKVSEVLCDVFHLSQANELTLAECYEHAYDLFRLPQYRSEYVYKTALYQRFLLQPKRKSITISEQRISNSKADLIIASKSRAVCYEIKTERDSLKRLTDQIASYQTMFAHVSVLCDKSHVAKVENSVGDEVGILTLSRNSNIQILRQPAECYEHMTTESLFSNLRQAECRGVTKILRPDYKPGKYLYQDVSYMRQVFAETPVRTLYQTMLSVFLESRDITSQLDLLRELPSCLSQFVLSRKLHRTDIRRLRTNMGMTLGEFLQSR